MRARTVLGFAPHSGWAAVVAVGGDSGDPEILARDRVEMADPRLPGSKQPYHEVEGLPLQEAGRRLAGLSDSARAMSYEAIRALVDDLGRKGAAPAVAGILDSSGRKGDNLAAILASHALIHTADGDHFRDALEDGCARCGLAVIRIRQRDLVDRAAAVLRRSPGQIAAEIQSLGKPLGAPWGADQKSAALLGWLLLAGGPPGTARRSAPGRDRP